MKRTPLEVASLKEGNAMQGIDKIIEKIITDANKDAETTASQTQVQIDAIRKKHVDETKHQIDVMNKEAAQKAEQYKQRAKTMADLDRRRNHLAIKRELVEVAFDKATTKIKGLDEKAYVEFIEKILIKIAEEDGEIIAGKNEQYITTSVIDGAIGKLAKQGIDSKMKLAEQKADFEGGFILRNGKIETNCTIDMIVNTAKRDLEQDVASILFVEGSK
ncbi:MAG: V-type ATP synthase subunit E [Clostridiales bacterium]|nr:V-type ATP synthase subunit E [Clostridiales bacterium]